MSSHACQGSDPKTNDLAQSDKHRIDELLTRNLFASLSQKDKVCTKHLLEIHLFVRYIYFHINSKPLITPNIIARIHEITQKRHNDLYALASLKYYNNQTLYMYFSLRKGLGLILIKQKI